MAKITIEQLIYEVTSKIDKTFDTNLTKASKSMDKLGDETEKAGKKAERGQKSFLAFGTAVKAFVFGALARFIGQAIKSGAELDSLSQNFNRLAADLGLNADATLKALTKVTRGTVSQKELTLAANRAIGLGVAKTTKEFEDLGRIATLKAQEFGLSTTQAFDNIVTGIGRASPLILDNLGITITASQAQEIYAKELGKVATALTDVEKKEALKFAVLKQGNAQVERAGELQFTYNQRLEQASTFVTDLKDNIGRALLPAVGSLISATLDAGESTRLTNEEVNELGKTLFQVAQVVIGVSKTIIQGFRAIRFAASAMIAAVLNAYKIVVNNTNSVLKVFGKESKTLTNIVDNVGQSIENLSADSRNSADRMVEDAENIINSFKQAFNPTGYKGLGDNQFTNKVKELRDNTEQYAGAANAVSDASEGAAEATKKLSEAKEEASKKMEQATELADKLTEKLREQKKEVSETAKALRDDLAKAYDDFGESIKDNFDDTVSGLAEIVIKAEDNIKDLRGKLTGAEGDERDVIKAEIKEQKAILDERKKFEREFAKEVQAIQKELVDQGIDTQKLGIDAQLENLDLEAEIQEQRRIAGLNEFERFKEQQLNKLRVLTTNFVTEFELLNQKIEKQKAIEKELTSFLNTQNQIRTVDFIQSANQQEAAQLRVVAAIKNAISAQQRLNALRDSPKPQFHAGGFVGTRGGEVHPGEYVIPASLVSANRQLVQAIEQRRSGNNNSFTINAPLSGGLDARDLARELAYIIR
jgi:hypothetical protein